MHNSLNSVIDEIANACDFAHISLTSKQMRMAIVLSNAAYNAETGENLIDEHIRDVGDDYEIDKLPKRYRGNSPNKLQNVLTGQRSKLGDDAAGIIDMAIINAFSRQAKEAE